MKKIVAFMLCCMMMVGALSAFANDGVMPRIDCNHTYGLDDVDCSDVIDCCTTVYYTEWYCKDCGEYVKTTGTKYRYSHNWVTDIIDGEEVEICTKCDEIK